MDSKQVEFKQMREIQPPLLHVRDQSEEFL